VQNTCHYPKALDRQKSTAHGLQRKASCPDRDASREKLEAAEFVLPVVKEWMIEDLVVVSPDAGGLKRAAVCHRAGGGRGR